MTNSDTENETIPQGLKFHQFFRGDSRAFEIAMDADPKLTACDWATWMCLQLVEPFGSRPVHISTAALAERVRYSRRAIQRSLNRLAELGLVQWRISSLEVLNPWGKSALERSNLLPLANARSKTPGRQICRPDDEPVAQAKSLSPKRQICRPGDRNGASDRQNDAMTSVSAALRSLDFSDRLDPQDRRDDDEKINLQEEKKTLQEEKKLDADLLPEEWILATLGMGVNSLKRLNIHPYEQVGIEKIDRTTARVLYRTHPPFEQFFAWCDRLYRQHRGAFHAAVAHWVRKASASQKPISEPYSYARRVISQFLRDAGKT